MRGRAGQDASRAAHRFDGPPDGEVLSCPVHVCRFAPLSKGQRVQSGDQPFELTTQASAALSLSPLDPELPPAFGSVPLVDPLEGNAGAVAASVPASATPSAVVSAAPDDLRAGDSGPLLRIFLLERGCEFRGVRSARDDQCRGSLPLLHGQQSGRGPDPTPTQARDGDGIQDSGKCQIGHLDETTLMKTSGDREVESTPGCDREPGPVRLRVC